MKKQASKITLKTEQIVRLTTNQAQNLMGGLASIPTRVTQNNRCQP